MSELSRERGRMVSVILFLLSLVILGVVIYDLIYDCVYNRTVRAVVNSVSCEEMTLITENLYKCTLGVTYMVNGKTYTKTVETYGEDTYIVGDIVILHYNSSHPRQSVLLVQPVLWTNITIICICFIFVIIFFQLIYKTWKDSD